MPSYITSPFNKKRKPKFAELGLSAGGAAGGGLGLGAISTGLQLGQQIGNMMPDNGVGNFVQGVFDPMTNIGNAMNYLGEGKIGKGLLSMIPGLGNAIAGRDNRAAEAELKAIEKAKASEAYFANRKGNDAAHFNAVNNNLAAMGKTIKNKASFFPMGGTTSNRMTTPNAIPINNNAEMLTNPDGSINGTHGTGNNIPLMNDQGQTEVVTEPGEIKVDNPDGSVDILSKQLGFAQQYEQATAEIERLKKSISTTTNTFERNAMDRELKAALKKQQDIVLQQRMINEALGNVEDNSGDPNAAPMNIEQSDPSMMQGAPMAPMGYSNRSFQPNLFNQQNSFTNTQLTPNFINPVATNDFTKSFTKPIYDLPTFENPLNKSINSGLNTNVGKLGQGYKVSPPNRDNPNFATKANDFLTGEGGQFATNVLSMATPIVGNILNRANMRKAAKEIAEQKITPNVINTYTPKLNIDADVAAINSQYADNIKMANMSSSPALKNYFANVSGSNRISQLNTPMQQKANFDTQMKANNVQNANNVINSNIDKENALAGIKLDSRVGLELSKINQRNTTFDNLYKVIGNSDMKAADKTRLELLLKGLDTGNGVIDANIKQQIDDLLARLK